MSVCLLAAVSVASFPCPCQFYACKYSHFLSKMSYVLIKCFFGYTWWRVGSPSTFLSLLPLCCFPPHLGSQWGAAADLLRRRRCRDIFPHPVCTPVEASPRSTYTLFAQIKPENGWFLTKFTIPAGFGHHAANFTESVQPQAFGWQNDDKNDDR